MRPVISYECPIRLKQKVIIINYIKKNLGMEVMNHVIVITVVIVGVSINIQ